MPNNEKSPHILNTSAGLLGVCFIVLTLIQTSAISASSFIDEITSLGILLFTASCLLVLSDIVLLTTLDVLK